MATLEISEDAGLTYHASQEPPQMLPPSRQEQLATWAWRPTMDLASSVQGDLKVRVVPWTHDGKRRGRSSESEIFATGSNSPPRLLAASILRPTASGIAALSVHIADDEGDHVEVLAELAVNNGPFQPATLVEAAARHAVESGENGSEVVLHWDAQGDAPERTAAFVRLRLRARDTLESNAFVTAPVPLETVAPVISTLTLEDIDDDMNGSIPFTNLNHEEESFTLVVPASGFRIVVAGAPVVGGHELDMSALLIEKRSERNDDVSRYFTPQLDTLRAAWTVPPEQAAFPGLVSLKASVADVLGNRSPPRTLTFEVAAPKQQAGPLASLEHWILDFNRDHFTLQAETDARGGLQIRSSEKSNGVADYLEDLSILGLANLEAPPESEAASVSKFVVTWTAEAIRAHLYRFYGRGADGEATADAPNIRFHLAPVAESASRLGIGGDDPIPGFTIGRAEYDRKNSRRNDNSGPDLGIFTTNIIDYHINSSYLFRRRFDSFIPGRGTPVGSTTLDAQILLGTFDRNAPDNSTESNARHDALVSAVDAWARMVALVAAHEIGHSLGLVANGPPPTGLFGGERNAAFAGPFTNAYHLDSAGSDIMQAALSFYEALLDGELAPRFNPLHWAYLLGRVTLQ